MLEPLVLYSLQERYKALLEELTQPKQAAAPEPSKTENIQLMMRPEELWEHIGPTVATTEFFLLLIEGMPGTSKTTIARTLAHLAHDKAGFGLLYASAFDVLETPVTFLEKALGYDKVCMILDDFSYVSSATTTKTASKLKNFYTLVRHALEETEGQTKHIFLIVNAHFGTAVPPVFKNTNVWIFSGPTTLEQDIMIKVVGRNERNRGLANDMFEAIKNIQEFAQKNHDIEFSMYGHDYKFRWGTPDDPGDGRIHLLIYNGKSFMYNNVEMSCKECAFIGKHVKVRSKSLAEPENNGGDD